MIVYRLCKSAWKNDLSGRGAEITGGRWNSKGFPLIYTSSSRALCMAEIAVHTPLGCLPYDYFMVEIEIPQTVSTEEISLIDLPLNWQSFRHKQITQAIGNNFIKKNIFLLLKVPSAVVRGDYNYLLNPVHKEIKSIRIFKTEKFQFDTRLFGEKK